MIGWTMELAFSSIHDLTTKHDKRMIGRTSLLMFPIYGMGAVFCPLAKKLRGMNTFIRGGVYTRSNLFDRIRYRLVITPLFHVSLGLQ